MTEADFQAVMRRPLRDVITQPGGSTVDRGHMVDHTHDEADEDDSGEFIRQTNVIARCFQIGLIAIAAGCALMAAISFYLKGSL